MSVFEILSEKYGYAVEELKGDTFDLNLKNIEELFRKKSFYENMKDYYLKYEKNNPVRNYNLKYFDIRITYINHCINKLGNILIKTGISSDLYHHIILPYLKHEYIEEDCNACW